jgi:antitoxin ParD1/3/4
VTDIQLSDEERAFIEERVRRGPYKNMNDVVRAGLRSLQRDEAALKKLIQEGDDDIATGRFFEFGKDDNLTEFIIARSKARHA